MELDDGLQRVFDALVDGDLGEADLTTRRLTSFLGVSTTYIYHHHGSLDGFLLRVAQLGFALLAQNLTGGLDDMATTYVTFGLRHPSLYRLMMERPYDWTARDDEAPLREGAALLLWERLAHRLHASGVQPAHVASELRLLLSTLHGAILLAQSGRANVMDTSVSDEDAALAVAQAAVGRLLSAT